MKRRDVMTVMASLLAAGAAVAAGLYRFTDKFVKHYAPSPYDDLLSQVVDREAAATLGRAAVKGPPNVLTIVPKLRGEPKLAIRVATDAQFGRVVEVDGWIVPQSVADYSVVAYQAALFDGF